MPDESQINGGNESASEILTEADFLNEQTKAEAIRRLIANSATTEQEFPRPKISVLRTLLNVFIPLAVFSAVFLILFFTLKEHNLEISLGVACGGLGLYVILRLRAVFIWCILMYQRFAPMEVRQRCVFTPTCSQYAIEALKKYGVLRGVPKIISRLRRCHPPNGGYDPLK